MEFSKKILEKLAPMLMKHHFRVVEQVSYSLKLQSKYLFIIVVHNQLENSNTLWLGRNDEKRDMVEIDNDVLFNFFNSKLKLSQVSEELFISNLCLFIGNEAQPLINGDSYLMDKLENFDLARSRKYTRDLIKRQKLTAIDRAWDNKEYKEFVSLVDQIGKDKLLSSYKIKYKIAKQHL